MKNSYWLILFVTLSLICISVVPLWGSSEAREAHVAWEVYQGDHSFLPDRAGIVPSKPPLFHWLSAVVMSVGNFFLGTASALIACRFLSLLAGIGYVLVTFKLSKTFNDKLYLAPIIVVTCWLFINQVLSAKVDMLFSFFLILCLYALVKIIEQEKISLKYTLIFIFSGALSVLTKGPLGVILIVFTVWFYYLYVQRNLKKISHFTLFTACLLLLVYSLSGIWYFLAMNEEGNAFVSRQIFFENIFRIFGHEKMNSKPFWFYIPSLLRTIFPWSILLIAIFSWSLTRSKLNLTAKAIFFACFFAILALSISSGKRHSYPLPILGFFAVGLALQLNLTFAGLSLNLQLILKKIVSKFCSFLNFLSFIVIIFSLVKFSFPWWTFLFLLITLLNLYVNSNQNYFYKLLSAYITFILICATTGFLVKENRRDYDTYAVELSKKTFGQNLVILKDPYDESLDQIMYHLKDKIVNVNNYRQDLSAYCLVSYSYKNFQNILISDKIVLHNTYPATLAVLPCFAIDEMLQKE